MSGYDETNPEAYRPTEPEAAADSAHSGVDSWSASSQASPATASSVSEGASVTEDHGGYADLSQAYTADASQPEPPTSQLPAEPPTSQLPAEQSASLYAQPAQGQYQPQQPSYQPQQQPQGQYPAPQVQQAAPSSYSSAQQPYQGQQTHLGSPYMSVPTTPGGYAPAGAPTGESFYAASKATGADSGTKRRRRGPGWFALVASVLVASLLGAGGAVGAIKALDARDGGASQRSSAAPTAIATGDTTKTVNSAGQAPDWEAVSAAVSNAVVSIAIATDKGTALGSGVIFDKEGHIITNNHVVASASQIQVTLADGRVYEAETTGTDPATDLAVIQLKDAPDDLTVAQLGDSDKLTTGQDVMAIGNPLGLSSTATTGIISALDRPVVTTQEEKSDSADDPSGSKLRDLGNRLTQNDKKSSQVFTSAIQIDAAINPGNSGGPLFNSKGEVIAINSQIYSRSGAFNGLAFSIPINVAKNIADQLKDKGEVVRGWLGVRIQGLDQTLAESFGMDTPRGALVAEVMENSPAAKAAIENGDVIIEFNGKPVQKSADLPALVATTPIGSKADVKLLRDGKELTVKVEIGNLNDAGDEIAGAGKVATQAVRGLSLSALDEESRETLKYKGKGVRISGVKSGSAAERSGLRENDILVAVGGKRVEDVKTARSLLEKANSKRPVPLLIYRSGQNLYLALQP